jgi:transposase
VEEHITFVGLDVHKATIAVCLAEGGRDGEVRFVGAIPNEPAALDKLAARLSRGGRTLRFVYEAGPCGYGVYRHLRDRGVECVVVAPSLIPRRPGERIKTDRRDATALARLHRAGELTPVWVPDPEHEAMRDLGPCGIWSGRGRTWWRRCGRRGSVSRASCSGTGGATTPSAGRGGTGNG